MKNRITNYVKIVHFPIRKQTNTPAVPPELTLPRPRVPEGGPSNRPDANASNTPTHRHESVENGRQRLTVLFEDAFLKVISLQAATAIYRLSWWPKNRIGAAASVAGAAGWPVIIEFIAYVLVPRLALHTALAFTWLLALTFLNFVAFASAWFAFNLWIKAAPSLDQLTAGCQGSFRVIDWYINATSRGKQYLTSIVFSASSCVFVYFVSPALKAKLEIAPVSYVAVGWTAAIGANMVYWVVVNPELIRRVLKLEDLNLVWHSPASTPAVAKLSAGFGFTAMAILGAAVTTEFLAFKLTRYGSNPALDGAAIFVPIMTGVLAIFSGLMPHWWLYRVVRGRRRSTMEALSRLIRRNPPTSVKLVEQAKEVIELYRLVESSPGLPFSTAAMVQYAAAVLGSLVAYFLGR